MSETGNVGAVGRALRPRQGSNVNSRGRNPRIIRIIVFDPGGVEYETTMPPKANQRSRRLLFNPGGVVFFVCSVTVGAAHGYSYWTPLVSHKNHVCATILMH